MNRLTPRLVFFALLGLSVYGFVSGQLFEQQIWDSEGEIRLRTFVTLFLAWFLTVSLWRRDLFVPLTLGVMAVYTVAAVGFGPLAAASYFFFSCAALGRRVRSGPDPGDGPGHGVDSILALLLGLAIYVFVIGIIVRFPINYAAVYLALLTLPLAAFRRETASCFRSAVRLLRPSAPVSWTDHLLLGFVFLIVTAHWLVVLKPETGSDALAMHFEISSRVQQLAYWPFDATHSIWAVMPMAGNWCYTIAFLTGGEYAARLTNFFLLLVTAGLLGSVIRRFLPLSITLLIAILFLSSPTVQFVTGSLMVENFWAALLLGSVVALDRFRETGRRAHLYTGAILAGTALAAKLGAAAMAAPLGLAVAVELYRMRKRIIRVFPVTALALGLFLATACGPYLNAYAKTGNPVFPFMNAVFKSPYTDSSASFTETRFRAPISLRTLYDLTFETNRFIESQNGAFGFHYLLLLPLAVVLYRRQWPYVALLALPLSIVYAILCFQGQSNLRYLYPGFALCLIPIGAMLAALGRRDPWLYRTVFLTSLAAAMLNVYFLGAASWYHKGFYLNHLFKPQEVDLYLTESAPGRRIVEYLNAKRAEGGVAFFQTSQIAGLRQPAFVAEWHNDKYIRQIYPMATPLQYLKLVNELGIRYFVAPAPGIGIPMQVVVSGPFLEKFTEPEFQCGHYYLARLKKEVWNFRLTEEDMDLLILERLPAPSGTYASSDNLMVYSENWMRGMFKEAASGQLTYSGVPGSKARFKFTGTAIEYVYTKAFNRGKARIWIDGTEEGVIDLYSPAIEWRTSANFGPLPGGTHILEIEVLPEKHPASSGFAVDIDVLRVK